MCHFIVGYRDRCVYLSAWMKSVSANTLIKKLLRGLYEHLVNNDINRCISMSGFSNNLFFFIRYALVFVVLEMESTSLKIERGEEKFLIYQFFLGIPQGWVMLPWVWKLPNRSSTKKSKGFNGIETPGITWEFCLWLYFLTT